MDREGEFANVFLFQVLANFLVQSQGRRQVHQREVQFPFPWNNDTPPGQEARLSALKRAEIRYT